MHNNIMAAGSRDRPPMLATGRYAQWRSRFYRSFNTRTKMVIPYRCTFSTVLTLQVYHNTSLFAKDDSTSSSEQTTVETIMNMTPKNRAHFESEKEAIHLILTGIGDEILSYYGKLGNQRVVNVAGARETVGGQEVPNADSGTDVEPLEYVQYDTDDNVFANDIQHFKQSESISNTCAVEMGDSNVPLTLRFV
ncbi:hypothetical protein Tco_0216840 [Tanacetum coccineum]